MVIPGLQGDLTQNPTWRLLEAGDSGLPLRCAVRAVGLGLSVGVVVFVVPATAAGSTSKGGVDRHAVGNERGVGERGSAVRSDRDAGSSARNARAADASNRRVDHERQQADPESSGRRDRRETSAAAALAPRPGGAPLAPCGRRLFMPRHSKRKYLLC